jgi:uncharacterized protein YqgC (DUF456 family)
MKKPLKITAGLALIAIGLIGLLVPIMPGWVFIISGLIMLADYFPSVRRLLDWARTKLEGATGRTGGTGNSTG